MLDGVTECMVKRQTPMSAVIGRFGILLADVTLIYIAVLVALIAPGFLVIAFLVLVAMGVATYFVFRNTNLEYEYSYFEGEMRVDRIMGRAARKICHTFQFSKMDYMAPADSPRLYNARDRKCYNYTTGRSEDPSYAVLLYDEQNTPVVLKFTPNEELLAQIRKSFPRKIYDD